MATLTRLSAFNARLDTLLQGIELSDLSDPDRNLAVRQAVREYGQALPAGKIVEFAGSGNSYYLLYGNAVDVPESGLDAGIDLTSAAADQQLAIQFTLSVETDVRQVNLWLKRTGATVAGTLTVSLYTDSTDRPGEPIATSASVDIDGQDGAPRGRYGKVQFALTGAENLPAGDYQAVLAASGYTYVNGTTEVILGVDQSGVTNDVSTYNGAVWAAYGTDSAGIIEVVGGLPGWIPGSGAITSIEYPAADLDDNEEPVYIEDDAWGLISTASGDYLRLVGLSPAATETVRLAYAHPYAWVEASDPLIDTPELHFEGIANLAAAVACDWLAVRYGQKRGPSIAADSVERRTQAEQYQSMAKTFRKTYLILTGQADGANGGASMPGQTLYDIDYARTSASDFLFHTRGER
jgi:hypothetical protein